jgi:hypothetical protein
LSGRSSLDLSLAKIAKGADVDVEVYALKRSFNDVKRSIGNIEFRKLRRGDRQRQSQLSSSLKGSQIKIFLGTLNKVTT